MASSAQADAPFETVVFDSSARLSYSQPFFKEEAFNAVAIRSDRLIQGLQINFHPEYPFWEDVEFHDDGLGFERIVFTSQVHRAQLRLLSDDSHAAGNISVNFLSSASVLTSSEPDGSQQVAAATTAGGLKIVTRAQWGADESLRYWVPGESVGDASSGSSSGSSSASDPCRTVTATDANEVALLRTVDSAPTGELLTWPLQYSKNIRKIFVHHTDSDLKDLNGDNVLDSNDYKAMVRAIYRFHTVSRGWGDIGYNYIIDPAGTIYEGRFGGDRVVGAHAQCYNNGGLGIAIIGNYESKAIPDLALQSLVQLIAAKSAQYGIDPDGQSMFRGNLTENILGHRDVRATACPGAQLYAMLPVIRNRARLTLKTGQVNESDLTIEPVDYNAEWASQLPNLTLLPGERKTVQVQFKNTGKKSWDHNTWLYVYNNWNPQARVVSVLSDKTFVGADLEGEQVRPGEVGTFRIELEAGYTAGHYSFAVTPVVNGQFRIARSQSPISFSVAEPIFTYDVVASRLPSGKVYQGQSIAGSITLRNTGNVKWVNYGQHAIRLGTDWVRDRSSVLLKTNPTRLAYLKETEVKPGETGTFLFELSIPDRLTGRVIEHFTPVIEGVRWLENKQLSFTVDLVRPNHRAVWTDKITQLTLLPGERFPIDLTLKNQGDIAWTPETLRTYFTANGLTLFKDEWSPDEAVDPGRSVTSRFWVQAPYTAGTYFASIRSLFQYTPVSGGGGRVTVQVPAARVTARLVEQSTRAIKASLNQPVTVEVKLQNSGNIVWHKRGANAIYLAPSRPQDRKSTFYHDTWPNRFRAGAMTEEEVRPGETGTFRFKLYPSQIGTFQEYFQLVIEQVGWVPNSVVRWDVTVTAGSTAKTSEDSTAVTRYYRTPTVSTTPVKAPASPVTSTNSAKPTTPNSPTPTNPVVTPPVVSVPSTQSTPIRVLISYHDDFASLKADTAYRLVDLNQDVLFTVGAHTPVFVRLIAGDLHVELGGVVKTVSNGVRLEPDAGGIVEVVSMERRPSWDQTLNDNQFRGVMEIRPIDGRLHYINELPLEDYLKGLAEVSNGTPVEKQKAIAILARTYAQYYLSPDHRKFPGKPYDASDDPAIFQRYLGYGFEKRSPQFVQSLQSTQGLVVTYQGELIKTPYFSQSNGRTKSAEDVWGWKDTPYLQAVDDPYCAGRVQQGHGVGLSGCGAEGMANAGRTYQEIIQYYYQGVSIVKHSSLTINK
ncbi:SpoIID/LytB domain-containing protein [Candidatus Peregrinibacteria bacterium]|nr:MAG: SpoIID/LytB domain-containing protein [Candidatus Peregrinibacteria bacterium]